MKKGFAVIMSFVMTFLLASTALAETVDLSKKENATLYAVSNTHLDTQWQWTIRETITNHLKNNIIKQNFSRIENPDYPYYKANFEGAFRYKLIKEYYPEDYEKIKQYITDPDNPRWFVSGSLWENGDLNVPSPEALMRNILYGNGYFEREFGKTTTDLFVPDCFGASGAVPSLAAHMGLNGITMFATQKNAGSPKYTDNKLPEEYTTPADFVYKQGNIVFEDYKSDAMDFGRWQGPDGNSIMAVLRPGHYQSRFYQNNDTPLLERQNLRDFIFGDQEKTGVYASMKLFGSSGDQGGGVPEQDIKLVHEAINNAQPTDDFKVVAATTDQIFNDITPEQFEKLPVFKGDLAYDVAGAWVSQAISKRWNRKNELLADSAERASIMASWLGGKEYPKEKIRSAWETFIAHHFHDDLPGTSIQEAYVNAQNDYIIALNQMATELESSTAVVAKALDTTAEGTPVVVYNPLSTSRKDLVEAEINVSSPYVKVYDKNGAEVPAQLLKTNGKTYVKFVADVAPVSYTVFDVRESNEKSTLTTGVSIDASGKVLENERYKVIINDGGDVSSIYDKINDKQLLKENSPVRFEIMPTDPTNGWPAWNMYFSDYSKPTRFVTGTPTIEIIDNGPAVVSVKVTRVMDGSTYEQTISLYSGSDRVDFDNKVDWQERLSTLKARFDLNVTNEKGTFDLGLGNVQYGNSRQGLFEYPAQQWADITDKSGDYGVSIINDCKYSWDKLKDDQLRLTLIYTPTGKETTKNTPYGFDWQDLGENIFKFSITGHTGSWDDTPNEAAAVNQPLMPFETGEHTGSGKELSFVSVSDDAMMIKAIKQEEKGDRIIVRVHNTSGDTISNAALTFSSNITAATETNGYETDLAAASFNGNKLSFEMTPYAIKTFAVTLEDPSSKVAPVNQTPVDLSNVYTKRVTTPNSNRGAASYNSNGYSIPEELFEETVTTGGITFNMGPKAGKNAIVAEGQQITLPAGSKTLYILASSINGDKEATFKVGDEDVTLKIQDMEEEVGQWNMFTLGHSKRIKKAKIGTYYTHTHQSNGDRAYYFAYLFEYAIDVDGATKITLPNDSDILVMAATASTEAVETTAAADLYDTTEDVEFYKLSAKSGYNITGEGMYAPGTLVPVKYNGVSGETFKGWLGNNVVWSKGEYAVVRMGDSNTRVTPDVETPDGINLTLGKNATASHQVNDNEAASKALDLNTGTKWCAVESDNLDIVTGTNVKSCWLEVDLGAKCDLNSWYVLHAANEGTARIAKNYRLEYKVSASDDWQVADSVTDNTENETSRKLEGIQAQYVRLFITKPNQDDNNAARIYEFRIYGNETGSYDYTALPVNVLKNKPIRANGAAAWPSEMVKYITDGDATTKWSSKVKDENGNFWVEADLGALYNISKWNVTHAHAAGNDTRNPERNVSDFQLEYKESLTDEWKLVDEVKGKVTGNTEDYTSVVFEPVKARYVRMVITKAEQNGNSTVRIREWEVYGEYADNQDAGDGYDIIYVDENFDQSTIADIEANWMTNSNSAFVNGYSDYISSGLEIKDGALVKNEADTVAYITTKQKLGVLSPYTVSADIKGKATVDSPEYANYIGIRLENPNDFFNNSGIWIGGVKGSDNKNNLVITINKGNAELYESFIATGNAIPDFANEMQNIKVVDMGDVISVYVKDKLVVSITIDDREITLSGHNGVSLDETVRTVKPLSDSGYVGFGAYKTTDAAFDNIKIAGNTWDTMAVFKNGQAITKLTDGIIDVKLNFKQKDTCQVLKVFYAKYDMDGMLVQLQPVTSNDFSINVTNEDKSVKIFVWIDDDTNTPTYHSCNLTRDGLYTGDIKH